MNTPPGWVFLPFCALSSFLPAFLPLLHAHLQNFLPFLTFDIDLGLICLLLWFIHLLLGAVCETWTCPSSLYSPFLPLPRRMEDKRMGVITCLPATPTIKHKITNSSHSYLSVQSSKVCPFTTYQQKASLNNIFANRRLICAILCHASCTHHFCYFLFGVVEFRQTFLYAPYFVATAAPFPAMAVHTSPPGHGHSLEKGSALIGEQKNWVGSPFPSPPLLYFTFA